MSYGTSINAVLMISFDARKEKVLNQITGSYVIRTTFLEFNKDKVVNMHSVGF